MNSLKSFFTALLAMFAGVWSIFYWLYQKAKETK